MIEETNNRAVYDMLEAQDSLALGFHEDVDRDGSLSETEAEVRLAKGRP